MTILNFISKSKGAAQDCKCRNKMPMIEQTSTYKLVQTEYKCEDCGGEWEYSLETMQEKEKPPPEDGGQ